MIFRVNLCVCVWMCCELYVMQGADSSISCRGPEGEGWASLLIDKLHVLASSTAVPETAKQGLDFLLLFAHVVSG
jgi:hypothetical protein